MTDEVQSPRPTTADRLRKQKTPVTKTVTIYPDTEPLERYSDLASALATAEAREDDETIADLQPQVDTARAVVDESAIVLTFQAIGRKAYDALINAHPPTEEANAEHLKQFGMPAPYDSEGFAVALITASCTDESITEDVVQEFFDGWNNAEIVELFEAALAANTTRRVVNLGN